MATLFSSYYRDSCNPNDIETLNLRPFNPSEIPVTAYCDVHSVRSWCLSLKSTKSMGVDCVPAQLLK